MVFVFLIIGIVLLWLFIKLFKIPKYDNVLCVTGEIGTGKSFLNVYLAIRKFKSALFQWRIRKFFAKLFKKDIPEQPHLYSNMPICGVEYVPVTQELLKREKRFTYKSVLLLDEVSLVQDSMTFKDAVLNEQCQLFYKLYRHETRGGWLIFNTQSVSDNHFSVKRAISRFLFIHHRIKLPFFSFLFVRELIYNSDGESVNSFNEDIEVSLLRVCVPNRFYRYYDSYYLSGLTDNLPVLSNTRKVDYKPFKHFSEKKRSFVSFRKFLTFSNTEVSEDESINKK